MQQPKLIFQSKSAASLPYASKLSEKTKYILETHESNFVQDLQKLSIFSCFFKDAIEPAFLPFASTHQSLAESKNKTPDQSCKSVRAFRVGLGFGPGSGRVRA